MAMARVTHVPNFQFKADKESKVKVKVTVRKRTQENDA